MFDLNDVITVVQLVAIIILAILCVAACYRVYCYRNLSTICMKISGGDDDTFKRNIDKLKALKSKVDQFRKPLEYIGTHPNERYSQTCCELIKKATGIDTIKDSSLYTFAKILGASSIKSFISACKDLAYNASTIAEDVQTFTSELIPKFTRNIADKVFVEKYIRENFNDIMYALQFTADQNWITSTSLKELIEGMQDTDVDRFIDGIAVYLQ